MSCYMRNGQVLSYSIAFVDGSKTVRRADIKRERKGKDRRAGSINKLASRRLPTRPFPTNPIQISSHLESAMFDRRTRLASQNIAQTIQPKTYEVAKTKSIADTRSQEIIDLFDRTEAQWKRKLGPRKELRPAIPDLAALNARGIRQAQAAGRIPLASFMHVRRRTTAGSGFGERMSFLKPLLFPERDI